MFSVNMRKFGVILATTLLLAFSGCGSANVAEFTQPPAVLPTVEPTEKLATTQTLEPAAVTTVAPASEAPLPEPSKDVFALLFAEKQGGVWVEGEGVVTRTLSDDNDGSRHQRFILKLPSGQTLLIAHNIDIAPRVEELAAGDTVKFRGEYYYNEQGGGVHWTHRDPDGNIDGGWLAVDGIVYE